MRSSLPVASYSTRVEGIEYALLGVSSTAWNACRSCYANRMIDTLVSEHSWGGFACSTTLHSPFLHLDNQTLPLPPSPPRPYLLFQAGKLISFRQESFSHGNVMNPIKESKRFLTPWKTMLFLRIVFILVLLRRYFILTKQAFFCYRQFFKVQFKNSYLK